MGKQSFTDYCNKRKSDFLPLRGKFYGFVMTNAGDIRIGLNSCGQITVPASRLPEVANELKALLVGNSFLFNKKRAKNISTLIA